MFVNCFTIFIDKNTVYINQTVVPQAETVTFLGFHFDKRLTCKDHEKTKRKQLDLKTREINWLVGKQDSHL